MPPAMPPAALQLDVSPPLARLGEDAGADADDAYARFTGHAGSDGGSLSDGSPGPSATHSFGVGLGMGMGLPPRSDEVLVRNLLALLNKRGYNVRESVLAESSDLSTATSLTRSSSMTSTTSSVSSVVLALRDPSHGQTPLHIAVRKGDLQVLTALLEHESAEQVVDAPDFNGNTALHFAAGNWRHPHALAVISALMDAGADVAARNNRGLSPVAVHMLTLKVDNPAVLIKLLEAGADPDTEVDGASLLHLAARREFGVIAGVLVAFGASMTALNQHGLMCYEVASRRVQRFMVRSIHKPPPFVTLAQRSKCMRCKSPSLLKPQRAVANFFKHVFGARVNPRQSNCYHCGMLFCAQCLKHSAVSCAVPFVRDGDSETLDHIKTCRTCEAVLAERLQKHVAQRAFDAHMMGFSTSL